MFCFFAKWHTKAERIFNIISACINKYSYKRLLFIIITVSLLSKLVALVLFQINSIDDHSDINVYVTTSKELAECGIAEQYAGYCFTFSHMFWFAMVLSPITKVFGVSQFAYSVFFICLFTITETLLFDLVSYICNKTRAFVTVMVYVILPAQILLPQYITHENAALFFLTVSLWLYFKVYKKAKTKICSYLAFGGSILALLLCSSVNALGIVAIIALAIIFVIEFLKRIDKKYFLRFIVKTLSLVFVVIFGTFSMNLFQISHSELKSKPNDNKLLWTLYVGSNFESQGQWFPDKKWDNYSEDYTSSEIDSYHKSLVISNYSDVFSSPIKLLTLLKNKMVNLWGDFSYSIGMTNGTIPNQSISVFYNKFLFKPLSLINYSLLLLVSLIGCYFMWVNRKQRKNGLIIYCELFLLGTTALLLITECRNKYSIIIVPFYLICCFGCKRFMGKSCSKK